MADKIKAEKPDANQRLKERVAEALDYLEEIRKELTLLDIKNTAWPGKIDWGHVGSAAKVCDDLHEIRNFMKGK